MMQKWHLLFFLIYWMKLIVFNMMKFGIFGTTGKMGKALISCLGSFKNAECNTFLDRGSTKEQIKDLDFIVDFSSPQGSINLLKMAGGLNTLVVCGTTGFTESEFNEFKDLSLNAKVLYSSNFSLGVKKVADILKILALTLKDYDVEIIEKHHNLKKDAPSGTALSLGRVVAEAKGLNFEKVKSLDRNHKREKDEIGFASIRQGSIFGFHEVSFASSDERIWIGHEAFNKNIFAKGAIEVGIKASEEFRDIKSGFFTLNDLELY